jgi:hypothetical protein
MEGLDWFIHRYGYPAIFVGVMGEQFAPIPGEPLLLAAGALAGTGRLELGLWGAQDRWSPGDRGARAGLRRWTQGRNTISSFRAIVSCLTVDGDVESVMTDRFPATRGPAAEGSEADLELPQPCLVPIVLVTSPGGARLATTGF